MKRKAFGLAALAAATSLAWTVPGEARVTRIIIDRTQDLAGDATYETVTGRAFGELDPRDGTNALITDIDAAAAATGKAPYVASFFIVKPKDMSTTSGLMWHDVPNRGGRITISSDLRAQKDIGLSSGWQGDNAGPLPGQATTVPANAETLAPVTPSSNEWVKTPVVDVRGRIFGRIINRTGHNQPLNVMGNPIPYFPANAADNSDAVMEVRLKETVPGVVTVEGNIASGDWKFCYGASATFAAPNHASPSLPVRVCLDPARHPAGFDAAKLYQVTYTVANPYVLGAGTAAFRDVASFFRYEAQDDFGTLNPIAGKTRWAIIRGSSQSGNFTRHFIHLGMNQDEAGRIVHEGAWPLIAGRRVANNSRWGQPDGVLELYQMGSEGPQWWARYQDPVRGLPARGIFDRCSTTGTCPKVIETFGGAEVFALKMTTSWVGTDAKRDIPLPENVRRYYLPSSTHGGGNGVMDEAPPANGTPNPTPNNPNQTVQVNCPGNNWGRGTLRANPVPATALVNRMRVALREWVMNGTPPPPSQWPTLRPLDAVIDGGHGHHDKKNWLPLLVKPTKEAMGFPSGVPGIPDSIFHADNFIFPVLDYDWGPDYDHSEANGVPSNSPPPIRHVIPMLVPRVNADGNELGGVPTVLNDAPLGTYLGWNITAGPGDSAAVYDGRPFHAGQVCNYVGGMVPFAKTRAARLATGDPRPSLEERYETHAGYVAAVKAAANNAACKGYLLVRHSADNTEKATDGSMAPVQSPSCPAVQIAPAGFPNDWKVLVDQAIASNVCNQPGDNGRCAP